MRKCIVCFMMMSLLCSASVQAQVLVPALSTEMNFSSDAWIEYNGQAAGDISVDFNAVFGKARATVIPGTFGGFELPGGIQSGTLAAPWHMEISLQRPLNQNTAIGLLIPGSSDGTQGLFMNLPNPGGSGPGGATSFFGGAFWTGHPGPDFSAVPESEMATAGIEIYFGVIDATGTPTVQWGIRPEGSAVWNMAPPSVGGPAYTFDTVRLMIENRQGWYDQWPPALGSSADVAVDVDYIRVYNDIPEPATMSLLGVGCLALLRRRKKA